MDLHSLMFYLTAALTGISAIAVVVTQNIVRSATWLLFALAGTAGIFFLLGAEFIGATQLLIYVGGTLVLLVFGVMLTAQGPFINLRIGSTEWVIGLAVGLLLFGVLAVSLARVDSPGAIPTGYSNERTLTESKFLGLSLLGDRRSTRSDRFLTGVPGSVQKERTVMTYLLPFEIVSVHLLVVLVGAAYLARAKRRRSSDQ